eukprot:GHVQ01013475.1.p1 GENE.GHVQ01013475.1~~GHVQ01013475.1.p1  ORF type:complete len:363 (+),score=67.53 GHVQ01013475.1:675-1763(+)
MDFSIGGEGGNAVLQTIHSSEGGRAWKLVKQRQRMQKEHEEAKVQIEQEHNKRKGINLKFGGSHADALEEKFKEETIGLVSAEAFREKRQRLNELVEARDKPEIEPVVIKTRSVKIVKSKLSFACHDDDDEEVVDELPCNIKATTTATATVTTSDTAVSVPILKGKYLGKDPTVNTEFLSDPEREQRMCEETDKLIKEYYDQEEKSQGELLEVTYSYWDGSGHRRVARIKKGSTIGTFLDVCRRDLEKDFHELRSVSSDSLMYIKEDLILPHSVTFFDLIKSKARGKSGPLFHFDVHDDIRMCNDSRIEKDESHAGKLVDKKWYERNKHIFPASRWETYDATKTYEKYTIHGSKDWSTTHTS